MDQGALVEKGTHEELMALDEFDTQHCSISRSHNMTKSQNQNKKVSSIVVSSLSPQEVQLRPAPVWSRALAWTIISTASFGFIFAIFAKIDEVVLAPGELQPLGAKDP